MATMTGTRPYGYDDLRGLMSRMTGDEKHGPAATSTLDVLWVLYDRVLRISPDDPDDPGRDRFLLSKGHGPMAYYAVLAARGFLPTKWLAGFGAYDSPLGHHPDRTLVPGVEIGSGSLGHGLAIAVGSALGLRAQGLTGPRVWALVGDAEMDEGSNHEAVAYAGAVGLEQLHVVVVDNRSATYGRRGGPASLFEAEGWSAVTVDGRDHRALFDAFTAPHPGRPHVVVARVEAKDAAGVTPARNVLHGRAGVSGVADSLGLVAGPGSDPGTDPGTGHGNGNGNGDGDGDGDGENTYVNGPGGVNGPGPHNGARAAHRFDVDGPAAKDVPHVAVDRVADTDR